MENKITKEEFLKALDIVNKYKLQVINDFNELMDELERNKCSRLILTKDTSIYNAGLSVRALNVLKGNSEYIRVVKDLVWNHKETEVTIGHFEGNLSKCDLYKFRNSGKKTVEEIINVFLNAGVVIN